MKGDWITRMLDAPEISQVAREGSTWIPKLQRKAATPPYAP